MVGDAPAPESNQRGRREVVKTGINRRFATGHRTTGESGVARHAHAAGAAGGRTVTLRTASVMTPVTRGLCSVLRAPSFARLEQERLTCVLNSRSREAAKLQLREARQLPQQARGMPSALLARPSHLPGK